MNVADQWIEALQSGGYAHHCHTWREFLRWKYLSPLSVRKIIKLGHVNSDSRVVEFGCGGGKNLAMMALMGCETVGIDASPHVLEKANHFKTDLQRYASSKLLMRFVQADIVDLEVEEMRGEGFDLVFSSGVLEHFLDDRERIKVLNSKVRMATQGGWVINIVPSGIHPWRQYIKANRLGGYNIPEIDYTPGMLADEMQEVGLKDVRVIGHNLFGYLAAAETPGRRLRGRIFSIIARVVFEPFAPQSLKHKWGYTLIAVGQRPSQNIA